MDLELAGRVVLVTGAASGIGRATALAFAGEGATMVLVDRDEAGLASSQAAVAARGAAGVDAIAADVTDLAAVDGAHDATVARHGRIDVAFNNAGVIAPIAPLHELDEASWDSVVGVNLKGVWLCMRAQLRHMAAAGRGTIVNTASAASLVGAPGTAAYTAAKHGILGLTRTAALEYAPLGIRVNAVSPGLIDTPAVAPILGRGAAPDERLEGWITRQLLIRRIGIPDDVIDAAMFLLSDRASYVTGQNLIVDGGWTASGGVGWPHEDVVEALDASFSGGFKYQEAAR